MRCHDVQGLFSEIYDGVCDNQSILEKHIQECPVCTAEYEDYSRFINELRQLPIPELPHDFHETIMAKVRAVASYDSINTNNPINTKHKKPMLKAYAITRRWAGVAAAACLMLVCLWTVRAFDLATRSNMEFEVAPPMFTSRDYSAVHIPQAFDADIYEYASPIEIVEYEYASPIEIVDFSMELEIEFEEGDAQSYDGIMMTSEDIAQDIYGAEYDDFIMVADEDMASGIFGAEGENDSQHRNNMLGRLREDGYDETHDGDNYDFIFNWAAPSTVPISHEQVILDAYETPEAFSLALTGGRSTFWVGGSMAWTVAFAAGFAALAVSLAAMFWNMSRKK
ncbi:MAG: hypothetical protein FWC92_08240 [Defluviitaleaceae bacterium]|nr:hypothetical protein [Defluviitaleaceae bacterium]